jgi:hypothetical protein
VEQLKKKEKGLKGMIGIFILLIIGLFFFLIRDYAQGKEMDWALITIAICTLAGPATLFPQLKEVRAELKSRDPHAEDHLTK